MKMVRRMVLRLNAVGLLLLAVLGPITMAAQTNSTKGVALVIGNSNYNQGKLANASNDAHDISEALKQLGFDVQLRQDLDLVGFKAAIQSFGQSVLSNGRVAVFYYSGHGIQVNGQNYLIPVDAEAMEAVEVPSKTISLQTVFDILGSRAAANIVILDACRANPFSSGPATDWVSGLAQPTNPPPNSLIAFSTSPGSLAADGEGKHSPYTRALLRYIRRPGQNTNELFTNVRADVESNSDMVQVPWENTSLSNPLMFRDPALIKGQFTSADDDALVLVNGQQVLDWNQDGASQKTIRLEGGVNSVVVKVYNQRSYTGGVQGLGGHLPEGWNYTLLLTEITGTPLIPVLSAGEDHPQDNGPHHGKLFTVATMKVTVDEDSGKISVSGLDPNAWAH